MFFNSFTAGRWADFLANCRGTICLGAIAAAAMICGSGCASHGSLQPHQAFRQTVTPSQSFFQGGVSGSGTVSNPFDTGTDSDYVGYQGYNNTLPGLGRRSITNNGFNVDANQANRAVPFAGPSPSTGSYGNFGNYAPTANYNYQPAYSGGFTSGSC